MKSCLPVSLAKDLNVELILISDFTDSEIRIASTFKETGKQADRISFRKACNSMQLQCNDVTRAETTNSHTPCTSLYGYK